MVPSAAIAGGLMDSPGDWNFQTAVPGMASCPKARTLEARISIQRRIRVFGHNIKASNLRTLSKSAREPGILWLTELRCSQVISPSPPDLA
jgi:hypothetical protein